MLASCGKCRRPMRPKKGQPNVFHCYGCGDELSVVMPGANAILLEPPATPPTPSLKPDLVLVALKRWAVAKVQADRLGVVDSRPWLRDDQKASEKVQKELREAEEGLLSAMQGSR